MKLDNNIKKLIRLEYKAFEDFMYAGKSEAERQELAQFFTPPEISIKLIEELSDLEGNTLDPTSGSGNLLAAAIIAGANATKVYGNEYDQVMVELCRSRIQEIPNRLEKAIKDEIDNEFKLFALNQISRIRAQLEKFNPKVQIHRGNALIPDCLTEFGPEYDNIILDELTKRRNGLKGGWLANPEAYKAYKLKKQKHHSTDKTAELIEDYKEELQAEREADPLNLFGGNN